MEAYGDWTDISCKIFLLEDVGDLGGDAPLDTEELSGGWEDWGGRLTVDGYPQPEYWE